MQPHKPLLCLMLRTELERWDIGLHLPPRKHLSEVIRAVQLEQIPFQPVHNPERFVVSWQLGWKPKSTTTLKLITQSSFSLLALLCGKAMHDVLVFRRSSFFFFLFLSSAVTQKWLSNSSTDCIQSVAQWCTAMQPRVLLCRYSSTS